MKKFPEFPAYDFKLAEPDSTCGLSIKITEEQYKNWEILASTFRTQNNSSGYELLLGMIEDLKQKKYEEYNQKAKKLESLMFQIP